jgi:hypothetical protein
MTGAAGEIGGVGPLAQVVEQQPFKLWVDGSNPSRLIPRHLRISQNNRSDTADPGKVWARDQEQRKNRIARGVITSSIGSFAAAPAG